jgi:putative hemolysin
MPGFMKSLLFIHLILVLPMVPAHADTDVCEGLVATKLKPPAKAAQLSSSKSLLDWLKKKAVYKTLDVMAALKGLPQYLKLNEELRTTGRYLNYRNFGEMGLAEIGISVRYNKVNLDALNTGKPLIIVANHHLGIADGLALQYLAGRSRQDSPSLLFLARWIEKLLPHAVYGDEQQWGTAVPVEINKPEESDPLYETKVAEVKAFNSAWARTSARVLRAGGALIIFPAGHVASINNDGGSYPESVYDAPDSWQDGFLSLARLGKADIVFANVDSVNSEDFYRHRKRFGGDDKERVIWFFSEALAKKDKAININLSKPMSLEEIYNTLSRNFGYPRETLDGNPALTTELMRKFTYKIAELFPQKLDTQDSPQKITTPSDRKSP